MTSFAPDDIISEPAKGPPGVLWIVEGSIESYYKETKFKAETISSGQCIFQYAFNKKQPLLTYKATTRTIVLCAEPPVLKDLFPSYYNDQNVFKQKLLAEQTNEQKKKSKLRDRYFSSRLV